MLNTSQKERKLRASSVYVCVRVYLDTAFRSAINANALQYKYVIFTWTTFEWFFFSDKNNAKEFSEKIGLYFKIRFNFQFDLLLLLIPYIIIDKML